MIDAEKQFRDENGMSLEEAVSLVEKWLEEGKIMEAERGRDEILKIFPDHHIKSLFPQQEEAFEAESPPLPPVKNPNFLDTAKRFVDQKSEKLREMSRSPHQNQTQIPQAKMPDENERLLGVFCYAWVFVLIPLFLRRDSEFVQFHAFQGVVVTAAFTIFNILILGFLQIFLGNSGFLNFLFTIIGVAIYFTGALAAWKGKWLRLPIVSNFSEKLRKMLEKPHLPE